MGEERMKEEVTNEKPDSIEISRTSKGAYSWKMKLYYDAQKEGAANIIDRLDLMDKKLKSKFGEDE